MASRIEGEGDAPYLALPAKPQFLHVGVLRSLQRVHRGAPEARPKLAQQQGMGEKLILQALGEGLKLAVELVVEKYRPAHGGIMDVKPYGCKTIYEALHRQRRRVRAGGKCSVRNRSRIPILHRFAFSSPLVMRQHTL